MQTPRRRRHDVRSRRTKVQYDPSVKVPVEDYPWLVLDRLVTDLSEFLGSDDLRLMRGIIRARDLKGYSSLSSRWGLQSICSDVELPTVEMIVRLELSTVMKKYPFPGREKDKAKAAIDLLYAAETSCSWFNRQGWKALFVDGQPTSELELMRQFIERVVGLVPPDGGLLTEWCRHGPGSDTATCKGYNSAYEKYLRWPYHVTPAARIRAQQLIREDERWLGALEESYRVRYGIAPWCILDWDVFWTNVLSDAQYNRVTTVPKDWSKDRPIAIEPRLNLMLQLGVDGLIRRRLKYWGIDLDSQEKNQRLACLGSLEKDYLAPVTLDLSNASDTISLRLVKLLFPDPWYRLLCELRTPRGKFPDGRKLRYSKLSSMGNGFTFAIESLVFSALCFAAEVKTLGGWDRDRTAVFGDDIIVPKPAAGCLRNLLRLCGFTVNTDKSFFEGHVRESCGTDWLNGSNIRPVYVKELPLTVDQLFSHRNKLSRWASTMLAKQLPEVDALYQKWIPEGSKDLLGPYSDTEFSSYWHTPIPGTYRGWSYFFRALAVRPIPLRGDQFLFRKLMNPLRIHGTTGLNQWHVGERGIPTTERDPWSGLVRSGGSCFLVARRNHNVWSKCTRRTPDWSGEYCLQSTGQDQRLQG